MNRPNRSLAVVTASAPRFCAVCGDEGRVSMLPPAGGVARVMPCPHCAQTQPIPIYIYPPYGGDLPRGAA